MEFKIQARSDQSRQYLLLPQFASTLLVSKFVSFVLRLLNHRRVARAWRQENYELWQFP